jgi:hypothetical protein
MAGPSRQPRRNAHFFSIFNQRCAVGFSRAGYFFTGEPTPGSLATSVPGFAERNESELYI